MDTTTEVSPTEIRELTSEEFEAVTGGYKFCWDGPAGTGTYPDYADCGPTWGQVIDGIVQSVRDIVYPS